MRQKVLIIDDSPDIHTLVRVRLKNEQIELFSAEQGEAGLAMAADILPDLILLDVDMPHPDGFEVCRRLKEAPALREIPIIFLTGASSTEEKLRGLELGAVDYITKPFDPAELRVRVKASLRSKHLLDLLAEKASVLRASEERFRFLAEYSTDLISRHDADGAFLYASPAAAGILGYGPEELIGRRLEELVHHDDRESLRGVMADILNLRERGAALFRAHRRDGSIVWLEATARAVASGDRVEIHMSCRDVSRRKRAESLERGRTRILEMIADRQPLPDILAGLAEIIEKQHCETLASIIVLSDGQLHHAGPSLPRDFREGLDGNCLRLACDICSDAASLQQSIVVSHIPADHAWSSLREVAARHRLVTCWSNLIRSASQEVIGMVALYHRALEQPDAEAIALLETVGKLITLAIEHRQLTEQLAYRAQHDALTGLPNRILFDDRLRQALARAASHGSIAALFLIDLDRFKSINDTLGHHAGDLLLQAFTRRLQEVISQTDTFARMGGDEFALILPELQDRQQAIRIAQRIQEVLTPCFEIGAHELTISASIGIAFYPSDAADAETLQRNADVAMYRIKSLGRNGFQCYGPEMNAAAVERMGLENHLRKAIETGALELHYQPQVDRDGRIVGAEALLRWNHPTSGRILPSQFIPLAEETGLIIPIGTWVIQEACRQNMAWQKRGFPRIPIAANVSALQFAQPGFPEVVADALQQSGLDPRWLELEITETVAMNNIRESAPKLQRLKEMGIGLAIDDFGTGYSSLAYLQDLPIDTLKIDESFVRGAGAGRHGNTAVLRAIASLARNLDLRVIAEGVETQEQRDFLISIGCDVLQGFLFGTPRSSAQMDHILLSAPSPDAGRIRRAG